MHRILNGTVTVINIDLDDRLIGNQVYRAVLLVQGYSKEKGKLMNR